MSGLSERVDPELAATLGPVARDERSADFFDAAARGRLLIHRCEACSHLYGPELSTCSRCASDRAGWSEAAGTGTLVSWVVVHGRRADGSAARTVVATVELGEGPWLTLAADVGDESMLAAGAAMAVAFLPPAEGEAVPLWQLATAVGSP